MEDTTDGAKRRGVVGAAVGRVGAVGGDIGVDIGVAPDAAKQQLHAHRASIQACDEPVHCPCDAHEGQLVGSASVRDCLREQAVKVAGRGVVGAAVAGRVAMFGAVAAMATVPAHVV